MDLSAPDARRPPRPHAGRSTPTSRRPTARARWSTPTTPRPAGSSRSSRTTSARWRRSTPTPHRGQRDGAHGDALLHDAEAAIKRARQRRAGRQGGVLRDRLDGRHPQAPGDPGRRDPAGDAARPERSAGGRRRRRRGRRTRPRDLRERGPVVFVGPYEHHSNEVTWREGLCTVVEVGLDAERPGLPGRSGGAAGDEPQWRGRRKIGSFSAASNVTGVVAPVREIAPDAARRRRARAVRLRRRRAVPRDRHVRRRATEADGSTPSSSRPTSASAGRARAACWSSTSRSTRTSSRPASAAAGRSTYVSRTGHDYTDDVEARETAGTPGLYQTLRAALALDVKAAVGTDAIAAREHELLERALARWGRRRADRGARARRPEPARHRVVQRARRVVRRGGPLPPPALRDGAAGRPVRRPEPRRLLVRRALRPPAARHRAGRRAPATASAWSTASTASSRAGRASGCTTRCPTPRPTTSSTPSPSWPTTALSSWPTTASTSRPAPGRTASRSPCRPAYTLADALASPTAAHAPPDDAALAERFGQALGHARRLVSARPAADASGRLADDLLDLQFFALPA